MATAPPKECPTETNRSAPRRIAQSAVAARVEQAPVGLVGPAVVDRDRRDAVRCEAVPERRVQPPCRTQQPAERAASGDDHVGRVGRPEPQELHDAGHRVHLDQPDSGRDLDLVGAEAPQQLEG